MGKLMERLLYWIKRDPRGMGCGHCCVICEYFDWCREEQEAEGKKGD